MAGDRHPYWQEDCPARGVLLSHTFGPGDNPGVCAFCGGSPAARIMPPLDVQARLAALGLGQSPGPLTVEELHALDTLVEPRAITGLGPQGPNYGRGRGEFTWRDQQRLIARITFG